MMNQHFFSKKRIVMGLALLVFSLGACGGSVFLSSSVSTQASGAPYGTFTSGPDGALVATQTAFEPASFTRPGFSDPQDMIYDDYSGNYLVADAGGGRVCILDGDGNLVSSFSEGLSSPYGVSADATTYYVADRAKASIELFDRSTLVHRASYGKPSNAFFGSSSPFVPVKIDVNSKGIFVVSEGATKGVIQLDQSGNFVGYVGANKTQKSIASWFQSLFFSSAQKASLLKAAPASPSNLAFSSQGLLYTVTDGDGSSAVKKLNTLGNVVMTPSYNLAKTNAVALDEEDNLFAVTEDGQIASYDGSGNLLFLFGETSEYSERLGNLKTPKAVALTPQRKLAVLDGGTGAMLFYQPTDFAQLVFEAITYYNQGLYTEGEGLWRKILSLNSSFILSYRALAASDMKKGNYSAALREYELAQDRSGYSAAYWEIRNAWIQAHLSTVLIVILALILLVVVLEQVYQRSKVFDGIALGWGRFREKKAVKALLFQREFIRSPGDAVYEIKIKQGPNVWNASLLYLWYVILQILNPLLTSYLFNGQNLYNTNLFQVIFFGIAPLFLWIVANYFVATVSDGEGRLKDLYIGTIYALSPYLLMALPVMLISRILTYNESFVYTLLQIVMYGWSAILLFRNYSEMHDYSFGKTIKNLLLTAVAFLAFIGAGYVIYMMCAQLFGYLSQALGELFNRG